MQLPDQVPRISLIRPSSLGTAQANLENLPQGKFKDTGFDLLVIFIKRCTDLSIITRMRVRVMVMATVMAMVIMIVMVVVMAMEMVMGAS